MNASMINAYKGKTVLVTGHTGFKGSWMTIWLRELGANVVGYALDPINTKDNFNLANIKDKIVDIRGDIRDSKMLIKVFEEHKPDIVFHLAAQPLVRYSYINPKYTYEVNVMGTLNVLEAVRDTDETKAGIFITTDKCYENKEWLWGYRENDPMGGFDPYSSSKGCAELLISSYRNSYFNTDSYPKHGKAIVSARAGNVIGGGDWSQDRIVPDCIKSLEDKKSIVLRNPNAVRPWQHVLEPLSGYLLLGAKLLAEGPKFSGAWNFGPEYSSIVNVQSIVEKLIKYWGEGTWIDQSGDNAPHEASLLSLDISKAIFSLGWHPKWDIDKAVGKTIEWYKKYNSVDVYKLCVEQIEEYENLKG